MWVLFLHFHQRLTSAFSLFHSVLLLLYSLLYCSDVTRFRFSPSSFFFFLAITQKRWRGKKKHSANEMRFIWHDMQWTKEAPGPVSPRPSSAFIDRPPWNYRLRMRPLLRRGFWLFFLSFLLSFFLSFPPLFEPPPPPPAAAAVGALPRDPDLLMYDRYGWLWVDQSRSSRWMAPVKPFIRLRAEAFQKGPRYGRSWDTFLAVPLFPPVCVWGVVLAWAADFAPREIIKQRWNRKWNE